MILRHFSQHSNFGGMKAPTKKRIQLCFPYFCCTVLSKYAVGAVANSTHVAQKYLMFTLKNTSLVSLTFFCLLKCCRYHSAMFPASGISFVWDLRLYLHEFHLCAFRSLLLDKHSQRSNQFFLIRKAEVWGDLTIYFFPNGRLWPALFVFCVRLLLWNMLTTYLLFCLYCDPSCPCKKSGYSQAPEELHCHWYLFVFAVCLKHRAHIYRAQAVNIAQDNWKYCSLYFVSARAGVVHFLEPIQT